MLKLCCRLLFVFEEDIHKDACRPLRCHQMFYSLLKHSQSTSAHCVWALVWHIAYLWRDVALVVAMFVLLLMTLLLI